MVTTDRLQAIRFLLTVASFLTMTSQSGFCQQASSAPSALATPTPTVTSTEVPLPKECSYVATELSCTFKATPTGPPKSWRVVKDPRKAAYWNCRMTYPFKRDDSTNQNCSFNVPAPCLTSEQLNSATDLACQQDPSCSRQTFIREIDSAGGGDTEAKANANCAEQFEQQQQSPITSVQTFSFGGLSWDTTLTCTGACSGGTKPNACDSNPVTVSTEPICKMTVYNKPTAKPGHRQVATSFLPTHPDDSYVLCKYIRKCSDFSLSNTLTTSNSKTVRICNLFDVFRNDDASVSYQRYCDYFEDWLKGSDDMTLYVEVVREYYFAKRGQTDSTHWLWSWDTFKQKASDHCNGLDAATLEANAFAACQEKLTSLAEKLTTDKLIPVASKRCCTVPLE